MKSKKKIYRNKKERVLLSDVLPYELPVTFSNRAFYDFLTKNKINVTSTVVKGKNFKLLRWPVSEDASADITIEEIVRLMFDVPKFINVITEEVDDAEYLTLKIREKYLITIPFTYHISHKENDLRTLAIIHPKNQLLVVEFYQKYKEMILYYCGVSPYSIRRPHKISKFIFYKDQIHFERLAHNHEHEGVEEFDREYESLKTFFVYKSVSNIHKFYESYHFHRSEKKYNNLYKFDISKCFDSLYTHTSSWALLNKGVVKDNVGLSGKTFGGEFDFLMQKLNYNETNGIIIGPEFSRIFAEIILQKIDVNVYGNLRAKNLVHKSDYEIFRYVDDYFVFYDDESTLNNILEEYRLRLKEYKLYFNESKSEQFEKPIITNISRAKQKIIALLDSKLSFKVTVLEDEDGSEKNIRSMLVLIN